MQLSKTLSSRALLPLFALVVLLSTISSLAWSYYQKQYLGHSARIRLLLSVIGEQRLTEARICGSAIHSPYRQISTYFKNKFDKSQSIAQSLTEPILVRPADARLSLSLLAINNNERGVDYSTQPSNILRVSSDVLLDASLHPTVDNIRAAALVYLLNGDLDNAITKQEAVILQSPRNGRLNNDLATIYLERARQQQRPADLFHALSLIETAISLEPTLLEARFNRALILEELFLRARARQQWQEYLQLDSSSAWAIEARIHIERLNLPSELSSWQQARPQLEQAMLTDQVTIADQIVIRYPHFARLYALNELLPRWADLYANNNEQATQSLKIARVIGKRLADHQQDNLITDMVSAIDNALATNDKNLINQAIAAHQHYRDGRILAERNEITDARAPLEQSRQEFLAFNDRAGESCVLLQLNRCDMGESRYDKALRGLTLLQQQAEQRAYPYLLGRALTISGIIYSSRIETTQALNYLQRSLPYLLAINDYETLVSTHIVFLKVLNLMRDNDKSWSHYYQVLTYLQNLVDESGSVTTLKQLANIIAIANELVLNGEIHAAMCFYDEAIKAADKNKITLASFTAYHWRSLAYYRLGNLMMAQRDLHRAKQIAADIQDAGLRVSIKQQLLIAEGEYKLSRDPVAAITAFTKAIESISTNGDRDQSIQIYLSRARAYLAVAEYDRAEDDLQASIDEFERQRSTINNEAYRISFFESPDSAYDEMIKFQIDHRYDVARAFQYAETSRARALLDIIDERQRNIDQKFNLLLNKSARPLSLHQIQQQLPADYALLQYYLLPDRLLVWLVQSDRIQLIDHQIDSAALTHQLATFATALEQPTLSPTARDTSQSLYQTLISSLEPYLERAKTVIIVPDKELLTVPFATLIDPISKQYLIERYAIAVTPSASVFAHCLQRDKQFALKYQQTAESLLVVGNPSIDHKTFPELLPLPAAVDEANAIAKFYRQSKVLLEDQATKRAFLNAIDRYTVIHFAGHAIMDRNTPIYSRLLFADQSSHNINKHNNDALYAYELYQRPLHNTRLVVLAACQTASGRRAKGEGIASLARPFLAAGVPMVIGSLWNVNDRAAAELFTAFHAHRMAGEDAITALRSAKLSLIHHNDVTLRSPAMWASFIALGGVVSGEEKR